MDGIEGILIYLLSLTNYSRIWIFLYLLGCPAEWNFLLSSTKYYVGLQLILYDLPWDISFIFLESECSGSENRYWFRYFQNFDFLLIRLKYDLLTIKRTLQIVSSWSWYNFISFLLTLHCRIEGMIVWFSILFYFIVILSWTNRLSLGNVGSLDFTSKYKCHLFYILYKIHFFVNLNVRYYCGNTVEVCSVTGICS